MKGYVIDIEKETTKNTDFRRVLYTGKHSQLVLMSLKPGEEIGEETHDHVDRARAKEKSSSTAKNTASKTEAQSSFQQAPNTT